jgi:hypothetical protein
MVALIKKLALALPKNNNLDTTVLVKQLLYQVLMGHFIEHHIKHFILLIFLAKWANHYE